MIQVPSIQLIIKELKKKKIIILLFIIIIFLKPCITH